MKNFCIIERKVEMGVTRDGGREDMAHGWGREEVYMPSHNHSFSVV